MALPLLSLSIPPSHWSGARGTASDACRNAPSRRISKTLTAARPRGRDARRCGFVSSASIQEYVLLAFKLVLKCTGWRSMHTRRCGACCHRAGRRNADRRDTHAAVERPAVECTAAKRSAAERTARARAALERAAIERAAATRTAVSRAAVERPAVKRTAAKRTAVECTAITCAAVSCYAEPFRGPHQLMCYATPEAEPVAMPGRAAIRASFDAEPC